MWWHQWVQSASTPAAMVAYSIFAMALIFYMVRSVGNKLQRVVEEEFIEV